MGLAFGSMPITWAVEPHALALLFKGQYSTGDLQQAITEAVPRAFGRPLLLDFRETTVTPSSTEIQERLEVERRFMPPLQPRIAVVAADAARFGAASVMRAQAEAKGVEVRVFGSWEVEAARAWLAKGRPKSSAVGAPGVKSDPRGSETILLVDDEDANRALVREVLTDLGYRVLEARSGDEALETAVLHRGPVHLLLTDLVMPRMNGQELSLEFVRLYPETRVIFLSGYGQIDIVRSGVLKPGTAILQKPFRADELAGRVREVLDSTL